MRENSVLTVKKLFGGIYVQKVPQNRTLAQKLPIDFKKAFLAILI